MSKVLVWSPTLEFGAAMRRWRENAGLGIRAAAEALGVSYSTLQKLETGKRQKSILLDVLRRVCLVYEVEMSAVLLAAGVSSEVVVNPLGKTHAAFAQLVLHPALRTRGMDPRWLSSFSITQKQQWLSFARQLQAMGPEGAHRCLNDALGMGDPV
jgi:transcriptional regulator with XRE-family HTH domain